MLLDEDSFGPEDLRSRRRPVVADSSSESVMLMAKKWLTDSLVNHKSCGLEKPAVIPARLIDVGLQGDETVKPVTCTDLAQPYMTLSYCWGSVLPLKTTITTLHEHCQGIRVSLLPRTFRDAVGLVKNPGYRYLWVDAL